MNRPTSLMALSQVVRITAWKTHHSYPQVHLQNISFGFTCYTPITEFDTIQSRQCYNMLYFSQRFLRASPLPFLFFDRVCFFYLSAPFGFNLCLLSCMYGF